MVENDLISVLTNRYKNIYFKQTLLKNFNKQDIYTDALRKVLKPEHIADRWCEKLYYNEKNAAFVSDFKYGNYMACMAYLNCGADDFNSVEDGHSPSLCIALVFDSYYSNLYHQSNVKAHINTLNDLLYMYRKLKESPRGLNTTILNNIPQIQSTLKKMDALLLKPEEERFIKQEPPAQNTPPVIVAKKDGLLQRFVKKLKTLTRV